MAAFNGRYMWVYVGVTSPFHTLNGEGNVCKLPAIKMYLDF